MGEYQREWNLDSAEKWMDAQLSLTFELQQRESLVVVKILRNNVVAVLSSKIVHVL